MNRIKYPVYGWINNQKIREDLTLEELIHLGIDIEDFLASGKHLYFKDNLMICNPEVELHPIEPEPELDTIYDFVKITLEGFPIIVEYDPDTFHIYNIYKYKHGEIKEPYQIYRGSVKIKSISRTLKYLKELVKEKVKGDKN